MGFSPDEWLGHSNTLTLNIQYVIVENYFIVYQYFQESIKSQMYYQ